MTSPAVARHRAYPLKKCQAERCFAQSPIAYSFCPVCGNAFPKPTKPRKPRAGS